jgi:hypothetical protein
LYRSVFTNPLPRNGRSLIPVLHTNGCTCYNINKCGSNTCRLI